MQQIQINADDPATSDFLVLGGLQVSAALLLKHQPKAGRNREKYTPALHPQWPTPNGAGLGLEGEGDWRLAVGAGTPKKNEQAATKRWRHGVTKRRNY